MDIKIVDVAKIANVSQATVSRVLNNNPIVKPKTRDAVLKVIEDLKYVPHAAAKNLRQQKTMTIGVIVSDIKVSYNADIVKGIQNKAYSQKYKVVICDTQNDMEIEREYLRLLTDRSVDCLILVASLLPEKEVLNVAERGYMVGLVGRSIDHENVFSVHTDNVKAAKEAVEHLIAQGHRDIVFLSGYANAKDSYDRLEGYIKALGAHGIPFRPELVENGNFNETGGYAAMKRLKGKGAVFTAIFSANDEMALGVYEYCNEAGISIPSELAIIGVDNDRVSKYLTPSLSTINQPKNDMGSLIADKLIRSMNGVFDLPRVSIVESQLIVRQSSEFNRA
ncbi:LacI family DNA-binding transcriptional regulator [Paenibacillus lignilyticus]|uniref:LacI family DNA-binding transcriptional regulator n=1 Tax=Paenibacillus lignilyticus TaxID=1172615 RepID=A0ABS5CI21_9BACL|nr:LacI family DNA-binding transcriptional regulator [Paenibacillus lignilyticus]MBP3965535.1 LacI family DNA-binding transcriptional regulator [Paenibacillus lignilyticus]